MLTPSNFSHITDEYNNSIQVNWRLTDDKHDCISIKEVTGVLALKNLVRGS